MHLETPSRADICSLKHIIRENINSNRTSLLVYDKETAQLIEILGRFIVNGVSDSVLIVGPTNCGKTSFVKNCVNDASKKYGEESFTLIHLNGLIHINGNMALQEIIRSLHVADLPEASMVTGSFGDNLNFVLQSFKSGNRNVSKPIVFVMDEFEYFFEHSNQTLLYNLFDVTQTAQAPIFVVGITSKMDVLELFEKRIKSRFSHREISIYPSTNSEFYIKFIEENLIINGGNINSRKLLQLIKEWNNSVKKLLTNKDFQRCVKKIVEIDCNIKYFQNILYLLSNSVNEDHLCVDIDDINKVVHILTSDHKVAIIKDLSNLELSLVIAMKHQNEIYECEPMNFEMVYQRYKKFAVRSSVYVVAYPVVYKAFERLKELGLIVSVCGPERRLKNKEHILYNFVVTDEQIKEALLSFENLPSDLLQWASSSLALE